MSGAGHVAENPVTGERVVVRLGTEDSGGELLVAELFVRPGGAVAGDGARLVERRGRGGTR